MSFCDVDSATPDYARRFSGEVGSWFLSVQKEALLTCLETLFPVGSNGATALDIGGGHGQIVSVLAEEGFATTLLASEDAAIGEAQKFISQKTVTCAVGDPLHLPFDDKSFDLVTSFRILPHTDEWPRLVAEMCRVARVGVVIDYPTTESINIISKMFFGVKKNIEKNTRPFTLFSKKEIRSAFGKSGFTSKECVGQFVLPMALYRAVGVRGLGVVSEKFFQTLGFSIVGSPVVEGFSCR
jgi:2-polyprenyl-3-methyl-5-hydroxy-6-metoxy-1,4-benzoquinol methylase